ncbi:hypothetical protein BKA70DRAFT_1266499 [Coprinopsis sp. MPI-PUGE-AT-0042]|nr:hypothetical protein BKA70DRAFT_1266499 [Coprinopsis sp. MPI-PUGE-AT-0042]
MYADGKANDPRFPGLSPSGLPPSPSVENPGQVFPPNDPLKSSRSPSQASRSTPDLLIGNPFLMRGALDKVDKALTGVITILEQETRAQGESPEEAAWLDKFRSWRDELGQVRAGDGAKILLQQRGRSTRPAIPVHEADQEGGLFVD